MREFAVYKGEEILAVGTVWQLAESLGVKRETINFYRRPAYRRRLAERKAHKRGRITVVEIEPD